MTPEHKEWLSRPAKEALSKKLCIVAWILTAAVLTLVVLMREFKIPLPDGWSMGFLPPVHAVLNSLVAVCLLIALAAVKQGKITLHRNFVIGAMGLSVAFLLCYVAYHFTTPEVKFGDADFNGVVSDAEKALVGGIRPFYLLLLISHISLAGISLPFILFTFISGWTNRFTAHRRLAKFVYPMWLYVAVTGPICYWMLRPYYN
jgi:putative membrane protein